MIVYLVCPTIAVGVAEGNRRGWHQLAASRFATHAGHDVRVIVRPDELDPLPGVTAMMRIGWDEGPPQTDAIVYNAWPYRRASFEQFVASGLGRWIADPDELTNATAAATPPTRDRAF